MQVHCAYVFAAAACFPHSEEPFQREKALYRVMQRYFRCAASPSVEVFAGRGPGEGVFFKKPLLPFPNPTPPPAKIFDLIEFLLLGLPML